VTHFSNSIPSFQARQGNSNSLAQGLRELTLDGNACCSHCETEGEIIHLFDQTRYFGKEKAEYALIKSEEVGNHRAGQEAISPCNETAKSLPSPAAENMTGFTLEE